jgi:hypothetical protein
MFYQVDLINLTFTLSCRMQYLVLYYEGWKHIDSIQTFFKDFSFEVVNLTFKKCDELSEVTW